MAGTVAAPAMDINVAFGLPAVSARLAEQQQRLRVLYREAPWPEPALFVGGFLGGPAIIGTLTPMRNATTLAAQDKVSSIRQIYGRIFAKGLRSGWTGMSAPMVPATIQFTILGPGYHIALGLLGNPAAATAAGALVESLITYGPTTRNAQLANNAVASPARQVPLRPIYLPVGPGFSGIFLRNCAANAGIRLFAPPIHSALGRAREACKAETVPMAVVCPFGDFLASLTCGALSMPFNQCYQYSVTSAAVLAASPLERLRLSFGFLHSQYLVRTASGGLRLSHIVLRDLALRSSYIGLMFTSFAAVERLAFSCAHLEPTKWARSALRELLESPILAKP